MKSVYVIVKDAPKDVHLYFSGFFSPFVAWTKSRNSAVEFETKEEANLFTQQIQEGIVLERIIEHEEF